MEEANVAGPDQELVLPEQEFTYLAGSTDRPWSHFTGRWEAMRPRLAEILASCGSEQYLRIVDLGSCTGFFSLQAAHYHRNADIIGVEGSVGVGNGTVGMAGSARQILATDAVQTHLRWIQRLGLENCFVAPEVWDYARVCDLASQGRPICDVMFLLSVIHHVDSVSTQQYTSAGLSRLDGLVDLMGKLLTLAPRHFVELPNRPWIACAYDAFGTQRSILEAAAKASGLSWNFTGPIHTAEWFGLRELWILEAANPMLPVDVQSCPFPTLCRGEDQDLVDPQEDDLLGDLGALGAYGGALDPAYADGFGLGGGVPGVAGAQQLLAGARGGLADPALGDAAQLGRTVGEGPYNVPVACQALGGSLVDPGLMMLTEPYGHVEDYIGEALNAAPTQLLLAHLTLREAINEAQDLLNEVHSSGVLEEHATQRAQGGELAPHGRQAMLLPPRGLTAAGALPPRGGPAGQPRAAPLYAA